MVPYLSYGKTFRGLILASLDKKGKQIESHAAVLEKNSLEANNTLIVYNATHPIDIKNHDVSVFLSIVMVKLGI